MIPANELRVGNRITARYNEESFDIEVTDISKHGVNMEEVWYDGESFNEYTKLESCFPIPLTPEILGNCGWIWNEECDSYEKYPNGDARMNLKQSTINGSWQMFNYVLNALIAKQIFYLHQLQNLYFALTGKELNFPLG